MITVARFLLELMQTGRGNRILFMKEGMKQIHFPEMVFSRNVKILDKRFKKLAAHLEYHQRNSPSVTDVKNVAQREGHVNL